MVIQLDTRVTLQQGIEYASQHITMALDQRTVFRQELEALALRYATLTLGDVYKAADKAKHGQANRWARRIVKMGKE